ncbi:RecF/RecN/SMC domain protein [Klebsiella pneumoniae subsp. rhinoscleromatis]|nr:RecF/RecN/SMC domain protein [Klebsiella pneumoniae subsp. rhinoscleromatis]
MKMSRCSVSLASRTVFPKYRECGRPCAVGGFIMNSRLAVIRRCVSRPWVTVLQSSTAMARISPPPFRPLSRSAREEILHEILADAFPGYQFYCENEHSRFALKMRREGIRRPLLAAEMSDGTLRFLCLAVALLSPRPPGVSGDQ